ncbi:unnamed protein product, partial [Polarella glacialis]
MDASESSSKRQRLTACDDLLGLLERLPKDLATPRGGPLNVFLLRFLESQALAACCKTTLDWMTDEGRRILPCFSDECRGIKGPFPILERVAARHVDFVRLGRYGREDAPERLHVITACSEASALRCVYAKLTGIGAHLQDSTLLLSLRRLRFNDCGLELNDLSQLLRCSPQLEVLDVFGETLAGLGEALLSQAPVCKLQAVELTDTGLTAADAAAICQLFSASLRSVHIQASDLHGLRVPKMPVLQVLSLHDCCLSRLDAVSVASRCPAVEVLTLCGNALGDKEEEDEFSPASPLSSPMSRASGCRWPAMPALLRADFRTCGFDSDDEEDLRNSLPEKACLEFRTKIANEQAVAGAATAGE